MTLEPVADKKIFYGCRHKFTFSNIKIQIYKTLQRKRGLKKENV